MGSSWSGLSLVHGYLSAQAYVQARMAVTAPAARNGGAAQAPGPQFSHSVFFSSAPTQVSGLFRVHPYREAIGGRFEELAIPQEVSEYLVASSRSTGKRYSVFRHDNGVEPIHYEVREGTENRHDSNFLGDEVYSQIEADFFGTEFVAHVHPPGQNPLPSETDKRLISERAWQYPGRTFQHIVFGFRDGEPIYTVISSRFP